MPRKYPHLILHRHRRVVRMIVPADVREAIGQTVFKVSTGQGDEHRAVVVAAPINRRTESPDKTSASKPAGGGRS